MRIQLTVCLLVLGWCAHRAVAQAAVDPEVDSGFYFHGTVKIGSPSVPAPGTGAKLVRAASGAPTQVVLTPAQFDVPDTVQIVAVSYANEEYGEWSIHQNGVQGRHHRVEFTVNPRTIYPPSGFVRNTVFGIECVNTCATSNSPTATAVICPPASSTLTSPFPVSSATAPSAADDLEGLAWEQSPALPVFFTVAASSVSAIRALGVSRGNNDLATFESCDVLYSAGAGTLLNAKKGNTLGLRPGDVMNALSITTLGAAVVGFAPDSTSVAGHLSIGVPPHTILPEANTLYSYVPSALQGLIAGQPSGYYYDTFNVWATAGEIGLSPISGSGWEPGFSDVRGDVRIHDPSETFSLGGNIPLRGAYDKPGNNYVSRRCLTVNELDGGVFGVVYVDTSSTYTIHVRLDGLSAFPPDSWALFSTFGQLDGRTWLNGETVPFAGPPGASNFVDMPYRLVDYNFDPLGCFAVCGNGTIDNYLFHGGYLTPQLPSSQHDWILQVPSFAQEYDVVLTVVAYQAGSTLPPKRSQTMTVRFRDPAAGWPVP